MRSACLETLVPAGLATPSLELIRLALLAPPLGEGCLESFLPQQPLPGTWHKPVWAPRPQPLATPPGGSSKMYKCLKTHPQPPKPFTLLSWGDPYLSMHIFRDIFKVKASFDASQGSFWGRKFSGRTPAPGRQKITQGARGRESWPSTAAPESTGPRRQVKRSTNLTIQPTWVAWSVKTKTQQLSLSPAPSPSTQASSSVLREGPPSSWILIRLTGPQTTGADTGPRASPSWELLGEAHCTFPHERKAQDSGLLGYRVAHRPNLPEEPECSSEGLTQTPEVERPN